MADFILHHYPPSPVAEKVRTAFGLKKLRWRSCEQNRLPDRPELFAMTGGYRRIPVMQVGADIFCDTQCILPALDRIAPEPSLFPDGFVGLPIGFSRWTDNELFQTGFRAAFAPVMDKLPPALLADRARLYIGEDADMAAELADMPHTLAQMRAMLGWMDERLGHAPHLFGARPGYGDLVLWYFVWFVRERYPDAETFFAEFENILAWAARMAAIGHGDQSAITPAEALAIAKTATPQTAPREDPRDPQGLKPGMTASVAPLTDSGETAVTGAIRAVARDWIALTIEGPETGELAVHFPRVGYRVTPQG